MHRTQSPSTPRRAPRPPAQTRASPSPLAGLLCAAALFLPAAAFCAEGPPRPDPQAVVAIVGEEPVRAADVDRVLAKAVGTKEVAQAALPVLKAQALEEIVQRRLVLAYARRVGEAPAPAEIDAGVAALKAALDAQKRTVADYLGEQGAAEPDLRRQVEWNLLWPKYVARYVTDDRVEARFDARRPDYDGTEIAVSHVLLRHAPGAGPDAREKLVARAETIRQEIASGLSFAEAARKYSESPTRAAGGSLGLIGRRGPMVESFSKAAFALKQGEVSPPVLTPFGVHLIRCDGVKPGPRQLAEARKEVEQDLARELLEKLAAAQRPFTPVKYTGTSPHLAPETPQGGAP